MNNTVVHPTAIIGPEVTLGNGVFIGPFSVLTGKISVGDNTSLYAHVTVGYPAQVKGLSESLGTITIGKNCQIREFVSIHASRYSDGKTVVGDNCFIMAYSHIGHDVILDRDVVLTNNVQLAGHVHVEKNVILMANSAIHQFCRVGQYTAIAPYSGARLDIPPFCLLEGQPGCFAGLNLVGLKRAGFTSESIQNLRQATRLYFQKKIAQEELFARAASEAWGEDQAVKQFLEFIKTSKRGVSRRTIATTKNSLKEEVGAL